MLQYVKTGIEGLDEILRGGFIKGCTYLLEGPPGSGKTIFCLQFLINGALKYNERGIYISFEETPSMLEVQAESLGLDLKPLIAEEKIKIIYTQPDIFYAQNDAENLIGNYAAQMDAKRVVIDTITHFESFMKNKEEWQKLVYNLHHKLKKQNLTSILVKESQQEGEFEEFFVDGIIRLSFSLTVSNRRHRTIELLKSRGQPSLGGKHTFFIGKDGISIYPLHPLITNRFALDVDKPRIKTGIEGLDFILNGGIPEGYIILLLGEPGSGRATFGLQFLYYGAKELQEGGIFFSFKRLPAEIYSKLQYFNWDLSDIFEKNLLQIQYNLPFSLRVDEHILMMVDDIKNQDAKRVIIDGLQNLFSPLKDQAHIKEKLFNLMAFLHQLKVTCFLISDISGISQTHDGLGTEQLADGVFILKALKGREAKERYLEVTKMRAVAYETGNFMVKITPQGLRLITK